MSPLISISPDLSQDTVLYRTMDFFSASLLHSSKHLMFSRADTFIDKNEGIDRLLTQLSITRPGSGCGMGWSNLETARDEHKKLQKSHYISCWSLTAESVAMWSLYSQDFCSVRISTRLSKLVPAVDSLLSKYSISRITADNFNSRVPVSVEARIEPVTYANIAMISSKVNRRALARQRLQARYKRNGLNEPTIDEINPRYWEREEQRRFNELRTTCQLKDSSFSHEAEVRLSVRLGEELCTPAMLEEKAMLDPNHPYHRLLREQLKSWQWINKSSIPEREFAECHPNLIETVAIDPRCPGYKASFIASWFRERGVQVVNSTCFGYLPDSFSTFPEW